MNIMVSEETTASPKVDNRPQIRIVTVGHVDHGKSTLIGRLLHETDSLPEGKLDALKAVSARRGMPFEWSFLLDALQTERNQGITLDTSQIRFRTPSRDVVLIDAPGHFEFLRNMITGASQADAALLIIDVMEGVRDQTRRHAYLLHLMGIHQITVVVNKMDRIKFNESRFREVEAEIAAHLAGFGLTATAILPISARSGEGVAHRTEAIPWHTGPTVLEVLDRFSITKPDDDLPLRLPVQAVYKFDDRRIIAGRVESGRVAVGDDIIIAPRGTKARVQSIEAWPVPNDAKVPLFAEAGRSVGITLDSPVFLDRGDIISAIDTPCKATQRLRARVFWLHQTPLASGNLITVRIGVAEGRGTVALIENAVDPGTLTPTDSSVIAQNNVGEIEIALQKPIAADIYGDNAQTGRLVIEVNGRIAGGGLILAIDTQQPYSESNQSDRSPIAPRTNPAAPKDDAVVVPDRATGLSSLLKPLSPGERLARFRREVDGTIIFTTSFGLEDQVILHLLAEQTADIEVVTLDTGRLFPETYDLWAKTERRYGRRIKLFYPDNRSVEAFAEKHGINGFYDSRDARLSCCHIRKVEPLNRALAGATGWVVGLRADQSDSRTKADLVTLDSRNLLKLSPLFDWKRDEVASFAAENDIPINPLHTKSYASIGCAPCTRAIAPDEPERAGRWWWEQDDKKECGLHKND
jgi:sulfate adenylyltransferase large subunit/thioredoxin-dependent adenylylsulfate APS reductase